MRSSSPDTAFAPIAAPAPLTAPGAFLSGRSLPPQTRRPVSARRTRVKPPTAAWHLVVTHFAGLTDAGVTSALAATCGLGLAGIVGGAATADARAAFEARRERQRRLARGVREHVGEERDWEVVERPLPSMKGLSAIGGPARRSRLALSGEGDVGGEFWAAAAPAELDPLFERFDRQLGAVPLPPPTASEYYDEFDFEASLS